MFFSKKQFHDYINNSGNVDAYSRGTYKRLYLGGGSADAYGRSLPVHSLTYKEASIILRKVKKQLADRDLDNNQVGLGKWFRPWHVVPALKNFRPPAGDFGIGVEVELGFRSMQAVRDVAHHIKDWKHITLDREGGTYPLEVTFPPTLYSKLGKRSQVMRYLAYLNTVSDTIMPHTAGNLVGTHVNVSVGGVTDFYPYAMRMSAISNIISRYLTIDQQIKYFGRRPYGCLFNRGSHIEMKLFNSQLDPKRLQQYIDIAVSLAKLLVNNGVEVTLDSVVATLEEGFNKSLPSVAANVSVTPLPLAA